MLVPADQNFALAPGVGRVLGYAESGPGDLRAPATVLSFYHGHYDQYQYFPLYVFDGTTGFPLAAWLRPGTVHASCGAAPVLGDLVSKLRTAWPGVRIRIRSGSDSR